MRWLGRTLTLSMGIVVLLGLLLVLWPVLLIYLVGVLTYLVAHSRTKRVAADDHGRKEVWRHLWTFSLFVGGGVFFSVLPYHAIVENQMKFWVVVILGLGVSFICAASELAFALACGEKEDSVAYQKNKRKLGEFQLIYDDDSKDREVRDQAKAEADRLELLLKIGEKYASRHSPTLVVANNVANILVAVVSTAAIFNVVVPENVGSPCAWTASASTANSPLFAWILGHLPTYRCLRCFGHSVVPFPVNSEIFQSAFALTLILIVGEMIPKQLASLRPEGVARRFFPIYHWVGGVFSLWTGPSFGALGQAIERRMKTIQDDAEP